MVEEEGAQEDRRQEAEAPDGVRDGIDSFEEVHEDSLIDEREGAG